MKMKSLTMPWAWPLFIVIILQFLAEVTSQYHRNMSLNFLCDPREVSGYVRDVPWDCSAYVVCFRGRAIPNQCPLDKLYGGKGRGHKCLPDSMVDSTRCHRQIFEYISHICDANPTAKIPSPESCHTYLDCSNVATSVQERVEYVDYLLECPYPDLFSIETGQCQSFSFVKCRHRQEPKAPCDYFQYLQLYDCRNKDCAACSQHHPSCRGLSDGAHGVPGRKNIRVECKSQRTVSIIPCPEGYTFSSNSSDCVRS